MGHHLYTKGFTDNYYLWTLHGESIYGEGSTSATQSEAENYQDTTDYGRKIDVYVHMVEDAFPELHTKNQPIHEEPTGDSNPFSDIGSGKRTHLRGMRWRIICVVFVSSSYAYKDLA